jgi:hypothetical protein
MLNGASGGHALPFEMKLVHTALLLASAAVACAQEQPTAPLSETREQLKALRKDEAARKSTDNSNLNLRGAMPSIATPGQDPLPFNLPSSNQQTEATQGASNNWLLERYNRLDSKRGAGDEPDALRDGDSLQPGKLDPNDPDYFLKLYDRQRQEAERKEKERAKLAGRGALKTDNMVNPFTPFLKDWLAGSPVGDVVRDSLKMSGAATESELEQSATRADGASGGFDVATPAQRSLSTLEEPAPTNPYLQALTVSDLPARAAPPPVVAPPPNRLPMPGGIAPPAPRITPQEELRRALPAGVDDAKKYFPQLKKF